MKHRLKSILLLLAAGVSFACSQGCATKNADRQLAKAVALAKSTTTSDAEFVEVVMNQLEGQDPMESGRTSSDSSVNRFSAYRNNSEHAGNARSLFETQDIKILRGKPSKKSEFPDCVAVGTAAGWNCTGTLIASNAVLTASHCPNSSRVFVGNDVKGAGTTYEVLTSFNACNPCGGPAYKNDLKILILKQDVPNVKPRPIGTATMIESSSAKGVRLVGYGATVSGGPYKGVQYNVEVPLISRGCTASESSKLGCHTATEFVAGDKLLGKDSCKGDSGGPALIDWKGEWYLIGATSRMVKGSESPCGDGGIYVRVDKFGDWIRSIPGIHW